jgi:hypothetical protein
MSSLYNTAASNGGTNLLFPKYFRKSGSCLLALFVLLLLSAPAKAQFNTGTITIDGTADATYVNGNTNWNLAWDDTYLYVTKAGGSATEPMIFYVDSDPGIPVSTANTGSTTGVTDWGITASLPFKANYSLYLENSGGAALYRTNTAGTWSGNNALGGTDYAFNGSAREVRIAWTSMGLGGRPAAFNFLGYANSRATPGFIYDQAPSENPSGALATPTLNYYWSVTNTTNGASTSPFNQKSYENRTAATLSGVATPLWDLTLDASGATSFSLGQSFTINNALYVAASNTLTMPASGGVQTITFGSTGTNTPSITVNGVLTPNNGSGNDLNLVAAFGTTTIAGSAANTSYKIYNLTVNNGATLQAPSSGTVTLGWQFGTISVVSGGTLNFVNGSGVVNLTNVGTSSNTAISNGGTSTYNNVTNGPTTAGIMTLANTGVATALSFATLTNGSSGTLRPATSPATTAITISGSLVNTAGGTFSTSNTGLLDITMTGTGSTALAAGTYQNLTIANTGSLSTNALGVTTSGSVTISSGKALTISSGARLITGTNTLVMTSATGSVTGFLRIGGASAPTLTGVASNVTVNSGGFYEHNYTAVGGTIPSMTWASGSTCAIIGYTSTAVTIGASFGQSFHHFIWNCTAQSANINLLGLLTTVNGNFTLQSTGGGVNTLVYNTNTPMTPTLTVGGDFTVNGNFNLNNGTSTPTFNIGGNFLQSGGIVSKAGGGATTIVFNKASGTQTMQQTGGSLTSVAAINVGTGATTNTLQLLSAVNLGSGAGTLTVKSGSGMDFQGFALTGSNLFTTQSNATLSSTNTNGSGAFSATGSIQSSGTKSFDAATNYVFNGTSGQNSGTIATAGGLTLSNSGGLTLGANLALSGALTLSSGKLTTNTKTLSAATTASQSSSSYVVADATGTFTLNAVTTARVLPIGISTAYMPVTVATGSSTNYTGYVTTTLPCTPTTLGGTTGAAVYVNGSNAPTSIILQWPAASLTPPGNVEVGKYSASCPYTIIGSNLTPGGSGPYTATVSSGLTSGSNAYLAGNVGAVYTAPPAFANATTAASAITNNSATSGGTGLSGTVTAKGSVWSSLTATPTTVTNEGSSSDGSGTADFSSSLTSLNPQTLYNIRAYATNVSGTTYATAASFYTYSNPATAPAGSFGGTAPNSSEIDLTWTVATFPGAGASNSGYIILRRSDASDPTTANVVNGIAPASLSLPLGTVLATNITAGATTSYNNTGLAPNTQYNYIIIPYTWDGTNAATYSYYTTSAPTTNAMTQAGFPTVATTVTASAITDLAASSGGQTISDGGFALSAKGIVWSTSTAPTVLSNTGSTNDGTSTADFSSSLTGLSPQTLYYVRAYATNTNGSGYGNEITFRSLSSPVSVQASSLNATATANVVGSITLNWSGATFPGGATAGYVLVYGTGSPAFTGSPNGLAPASAVSVGTPVTLGNVTTTSVTGLTPGTTYNFLLVPYTWDGTNTTTNNYLTAAAPTASAVAVGTPSVTTTTVASITSTTASSGGSGISANSGTISAKGVAWGTSSNPTTSGSNTNDGSGTSDFSSSITGLTEQTLYHYRAYVTNEAATAYGSDLSFRTLSAAPTAAATNILFSGTTTTAFNFSWTAGTFPGAGATQGGYLVVIRQGSAPTLVGSPDGLAPASAISAGSLISTTATVLPATPSVSSSASSLTANTSYTVLVIPYTWDGTNAATYHYYTTSAASASNSTAAASSSTDFFRTSTGGATSGNWNATATWETSATGGAPWITSTLTPTSASAGITIASGFNVSLTSSESADQMTISGTLTLATGSGAILTINNGTGDDITVASGGIINVTGNVQYTTAVLPASGAVVHVNNGGLIKISISGGSGYHNFASSSDNLWDDGAIFEWANTLAFTASNTTFFPNSSATIPIFKVSGNMGTPVGGSSTTTINGRLDVTGAVTWNGTGAKVFRDGITGSGTVTQNSATTAIFEITSANAQLGGGTLVLNTLGMSINSGATATMAGNLAFSGGTITVAGTLSSGTNSLSGTGAITVTGILKTANSNGLSTTLGNSGTKTYTAGTIDYSSASSQTVSALNYGALTNNGNGARTLASSGTIGIAGTFTTGNGSYTTTGSTVDFNGSGAQTVPAISYNNLTISGTRTSNNITLASSGTIGIAGTYNPSAVFTSGSISYTGSTLDYNGTGAQSIATAYPYDNLVISNSGSGLTITSTPTVATSAVVSGSLIFATAGAASSWTLGGTGSFTLSSGATLTMASSGGITPTGNTTGGNIRVSGTKTFSSGANYIYARNTTGAQATGSGLPATITGTLTFALGGSADSPITLTQNTTAKDVVLTSGSVSLNAKDLVVTGTLTRSSGSFDASTSTIEFNGSSAQSIPASSFTGNVQNLKINNSAGVTINSDITLTNNLDLSAGVLSIGSSNLTVTAGKILNGSSTSYVSTGAGAFIVKSISNSGQAIPVGSSSYNPLTIASGSGNTLDWTVRVVDGAPSANAGFNANGAVSRTWNITPSTIPVPGEGATITFQYDGGSNVGSNFDNSISKGMQAWHLSGSQWVRAGTSGFPAQVSGSVRTFTASGLQHFSPYGVANIDAPLPVSMLSFTGKRANNINELKWITASESNNRGFGIERSADGVSFTQVAFVNSRATAGNSTVDIQYTFNDPSTGAGGQTAGKWYYRLKQTDLDGRYKYSQVVLIKADKSGLLTIDGIFPNPVKGAAQVRVQAGTQGGTVVLQLSDMTGRIVKTQNVRAEAGSSTTVTMNLEGLAAGQYHMKAVQADGSVSETVMVVKQ